MVNIEHYKVFSEVAKQKSMTKAADILLISQPAISLAIKNLESELGGTLFNRSNKGLELTAEGEMLYEKVNVALKILNDAENSFGDYVSVKTGEIKIGISTVLTKIILMDVIKQFSEKYPGVKLTIVNGLTYKLLQDMNKGELDFVIYNDEKMVPNTKTEWLTKLEYVFIHKKDKNIEEIKDLCQLNSIPFVIQRKGSFTRDYLDTFLKKQDITPNIKIEVVSHELIIQFVKNGEGIGFVYRDLIKEEDGLTILESKHKLENDVYIATNSNISLTSAAKKFIEILREKYKK